MPTFEPVAYPPRAPMLDMKLFLMYTRIFKPRLIWTIISSVFIQVWVYSMVLHFLLAKYGPELEKAVSGKP